MTMRTNSEVLSIVTVIVLVLVSFSGCVEEKTNNEPIAIFTFEDVVEVDTIVEFNASDSYDADNNTITYSWDFGDGLGSNSVIINAIVPLATHTYYKIGDYTVMLTVSDGKSSNDASKTIKVVYGPNKKPIAVIDGNKYADAEVGVNDKIKNEVWANLSFDGTNSYDEDGTVISYDWDFNASNGFTVEAQGRKVANIFQSGIYKVTLRVIDDLGVSNIANAWAAVNYSCIYSGILTNETPTPNQNSNPNNPQIPQVPNLPSLPNIPQIPQIPNNTAPPPSSTLPNQNPTFNASFNVHPHVEFIVVNVSFRSSIEDLPVQTGNVNNIDLYVYDNTGALAGKSETPLDVNATSNQTEEVNITGETINTASTGSWTTQVQCTSGINVEYTLKIYVKYSVPVET